ncbi:MAG: hypothetical protein A2148_12545 [Chloroflexi bacterium RBG_16_68_14]|nr:MAG: hypothetical protein A2148_12545 [Chloroflexi bacterium RBG_16_68_14]
MTLPADAASVVAALETLPQEVGGLARSASDDTALSADALQAGERVEVLYGEAPARAAVAVISLDATRAFAEDPELTFADLLSGLAESGEVEVEAQQLQPQGPLLYLTGTSTGDGDLFYFASWAAPDGAWLFNASAETPEMRAALVTAFVEAVQSMSQ